MPSAEPLPPRRERIVCNRREDGGVTVFAPSARAVRFLALGGRWPNAGRGFLDDQIARFAEDGARNVNAIARYVRGMQFGGHTTAEALAVLRDKDVVHVGRAIELWDVGDVPSGRWFRDAWKRSANGGPIGIDLEKARPLQWRHIVDAATLESRRRKQDLFERRGKVRLAKITLQRAINRARDTDELWRVWPGGLPRPLEAA